MGDQTFYKILTHDLRPPLQGGDVLPVDKLPFTTKAVKLNQGEASCAAGEKLREFIALCGVDAIADLADVRDDRQPRPQDVGGLRVWMT